MLSILKFLAKKSLVIFALIYMSFLFVNTGEINDGIINYEKGTKVIAGEKTIDTFNSITNNDFLNSYREKLHREANFSENKTDFSGKNGFKRDFLFLLYLKDALIFIAKLTILIFLLIILKRLVLNQKVI